MACCEKARKEIIDKNCKPKKQAQASTSITLLRNELEQKKKAAVEVKKQAETLEEQVQKLKATVAAKEALIANLEESLKAKDNQMAAMKAENEKLRKENALLLREKFGESLAFFAQRKQIRDIHPS